MTNRFPGLTAAAKEIAYDNDMVNRFNAEGDVVREMLAHAKVRYSLAELDQAEAEVQAHIAAGQLNDVCCGGSDRVTPISTLLDDMLNEMFEPG